MKHKRRTRLKQPTVQEELYNGFDAKPKRARRRRRRRSSKSESPFRLSHYNPLVVLTIAFYCSIASPSQSGHSYGFTLLANADELFSAQPQPEAQPLVYLMNELGSGDSFGGASYSRTGSSSSFTSEQDSPTTSADVAPALIEARCWNNYENDNDCKQLNVITAPEDDRRNQQQQQQSQPSNDDDSIITPVVIFEASSTIEPSFDGQRANEIDSERPVFMAPPYQSNDAAQQPAVKSKQHKKQYEQSSTRNSVENYDVTPRMPNANMDDSSREFNPVTRPSVIHYVITPQPKSSNGGSSSRRPATKTTTQGRKCRDENDADCDEPEDNQIQPSGSSSSSSSTTDNDDDDGIDDDDDNNNNNRDQDDSDRTGLTSSLQTNLINEAGSGYGRPTDDDNDDSTDDGEEDSTDDASESSGINSIQESTSLGPNDSTRDNNRLLVITSSYPTDTQSRTTASSTRVPYDRIDQTTTTSRRPQSGAAEIEVVVHSTLPPNFLVNNGGQSRTNSPSGLDEFAGQTAPTTTSTTTTIMPDETFTSKPIFPSSTLSSAFMNSADNSNYEQQKLSSGSQATSTTTELDLYTFKPIPIPVEQSEARPSRFELSQTNADFNSQQTEQERQSKQDVTSQYIHESPSGHRRPSSGNSYERFPFDDGWTTRKPSSSLSGSSGKDAFGQQQQQSPDVLMGGKRTTSKAYGYMGTDILPTMLLYASIIILVFITLIVVIMAYGFWRRNSLRRQALLAKAQMMNGRPPPGMIESMSQVSHLMHGSDGLPPQLPQQGLMSTYAQVKGSAMGKVTTSLIKPTGQSGSDLLDPSLEEENGDNRQEQGAFEDDSKEHLADEEGSLMDETQQQQQQQQQQVRASHLVEGINGSMHNQSGSWSTEDPTTTSSGSQRTQDSQQQIVQQQQGAPMQNATRSHHPYLNSLSDGRQNSSSISDSQCSPDPGPSVSQPIGAGHHLNQPMGALSNQSHIPGPPHNNQQPGPRDIMMSVSPQHLVGHHHPYGPQLPQSTLARPMFRPQNGSCPPQMAHRQGAMSQVGQPFHPMMLQNGGGGGSIKQRLVASRSIEDIPPSQHVGFVESNQNNQHHVPYNSQVLPHLIQARPQYQYPGAHVTMTASPTIRNSMISPQRIAMSPLATLSRRFPPGTGLNRNIYSEDSSSFMTTSPSLARTSSSSSFAFNMSNLPTPSSIKAKPIVDTSGRIFNDYTVGFNDNSNSNGNSTNGSGPTAPPVFGRSDRSEAWYV